MHSSRGKQIVTGERTKNQRKRTLILREINSRTSRRMQPPKNTRP